MVKIFRKVHFWKDHRTYLELEGNAPEIARGYPKEGFVVVKIGEQSTIKSAFKLDIDEARSMRDQLNTFLRMHDIRFTKLLNSPVKEDYTKYKRPYQSEEPAPEPVHDPSIQQPFFLFSGEENSTTANDEEPEEEEKDEAEFYF